MLKFLVDESTGKKVAILLKEKGFDISYCGDYSPGALDEEILNKAKIDKRILITNDKDFGEFIFKAGRVSRGVIFLRLKVDKPANRAKLVLELINKFGEKLDKNFVVVSEGRVRIRPLKI